MTVLLPLFPFYSDPRVSVPSETLTEAQGHFLSPPVFSLYPYRVVVSLSPKLHTQIIIINELSKVRLNVNFLRLSAPSVLKVLNFELSLKRITWDLNRDKWTPRYILLKIIM